MTTLLRSQRFDREPKLTAGAELRCQHDGCEVSLIVTGAQPRQADGCWVNGVVGSTPAVVWVTW